MFLKSQIVYNSQRTNCTILSKRVFTFVSGCSKCWKEFPRKAFGDRPDYSGYDADNFRPRYGMAHKLRAKEIQNAKTKTERAALEKKYGVRYSYLFELPYYDPVRMHVIDPMHNLLLGTAKRMFLTWVKRGILNEKKDVEKFKNLQSQINVPPGYGRLPNNTIKARKRMKAEEWKSFTLIYSLYCMREFLTTDQFNHWNGFVNVCRAACKRVVTKSEIKEIHEQLTNFCKDLERLYGKEACTPNTHLHLHLDKCMLDYGPVYSFWCFSFERFNGVLGSYHTNKKDIVVTTMRLFCKESKINSMDHSEYNTYISSNETSKVKTTTEILLLRKDNELSSHPNINDHINICSLTTRASFDDDEHDTVILLCNLLYLNSPIKLKTVAKRAIVYKRIEFLDETFASALYRKGKNADKFVYANFVTGGQISTDVRPAVIQRILEVTLVFENGNRKSEFLIECKWFKAHPYRYEFGKECKMQIWNTTHENFHTMSPFVPVTFIKQKFSCIEKKRLVFPKRTGNKHDQADDVTICIPLGSKTF